MWFDLDANPSLIISNIRARVGWQGEGKGSNTLIRILKPQETKGKTTHLGECLVFLWIFCEAVSLAFLCEKIVEKDKWDFNIFIKIWLLFNVRGKQKEFQIVLSGFWNDTMIDEI